MSPCWQSGRGLLTYSQDKGKLRLPSPLAMGSQALAKSVSPKRRLQPAVRGPAEGPPGPVEGGFSAQTVLLSCPWGGSPYAFDRRLPCTRRLSNDLPWPCHMPWLALPAP